MFQLTLNKLNMPAGYHILQKLSKKSTIITIISEFRRNITGILHNIQTIHLLTRLEPPEPTKHKITVENRPKLLPEIWNHMLIIGHNKLIQANPHQQIYHHILPDFAIQQLAVTTKITPKTHQVPSQKNVYI